MKLFLFGGAEKGEARAELKLIEKVLNDLKPDQLLHVPYARITTREPEWKGDWFHRNINLKGSKYLKASRRKDMLKVDKPLIFISGGSSSSNLMKKLKEDKKLLKIIKNAKYIIGESAGAKAMGEYMRVEDDTLWKGLGILKDTVIEPHYSAKKRQKLLLEEMQKTKVRYGVGIDSGTALVVEVQKFPKYSKIGCGKIELKKRK
ncbi:MAG: Type 1 glutamine amidotransferase-like domain-containing protein [Parcubacteria group bacterium]|jgi:peptidase E